MLIVDDSALARELIRCLLSEDPSLRVVGEAANGCQAVAMVAELKPDIVTMDIEMPVMGGLDAIGRIMAQTPVPILVLTAQGDAFTAFSAMSRGALDVVEKPDISQAGGSELLSRLRLLSGVRVARRTARAVAAPACLPGAAAPAGAGDAGRVVAIAASTGGPQAISAILSQLPEGFAAPILVTQHIADGFAQGMAEWLNKVTPLRVGVARDGDRAAAGRVYINPSEFSMRVTRQGLLVLTGRESGEIYHPPCNTLLCSVAESYRERAVGLILSGMGDDGARGMQAIRTAGGVTLAQDEKSSLIYGMNRLAVERGSVERSLALADIAGELLRLVSGKLEAGCEIPRLA